MRIRNTGGSAEDAGLKKKVKHCDNDGSTANERCADQPDRKEDTRDLVAEPTDRMGRHQDI